MSFLLIKFGMLTLVRCLVISFSVIPRGGFFDEVIN